MISSKTNPTQWVQSLQHSRWHCQWVLLAVIHAHDNTPVCFNHRINRTICYVPYVCFQYYINSCLWGIITHLRRHAPVVSRLRGSRPWAFCLVHKALAVTARVNTGEDRFPRQSPRPLNLHFARRSCIRWHHLQPAFSYRSTPINSLGYVHRRVDACLLLLSVLCVPFAACVSLVPLRWRLPCRSRNGKRVKRGDAELLFTNIFGTARICRHIELPNSSAWYRYPWLIIRKKRRGGGEEERGKRKLPSLAELGQLNAVMNEIKST